MCVIFYAFLIGRHHQSKCGVACNALMHTQNLIRPTYKYNCPIYGVKCQLECPDNIFGKKMENLFGIADPFQVKNPTVFFMIIFDKDWNFACHVNIPGPEPYV
jgi:hypothetical protein